MSLLTFTQDTAKFFSYAKSSITFKKNDFPAPNSPIRKQGSLGTSKKLPGDPGSIPGLGRSPGEGNGYPLQYSHLENSMGRGGWRATVHGVTNSCTPAVGDGQGGMLQFMGSQRVRHN